MKVAKWICRYLFFAVLLAGSVFWWIYCSNTVAQLNETISSAEYLDLASSLSPDALTLLERLEQYQQLQSDAMKLILIVGGCLLVLILWHIGSEVVMKKLAQRPPREPKVKQKPSPKPAAAVQPKKPEKVQEPVGVKPVAPNPTPAPEKVVPAPQGGYCTECGQYYDEFPVFCRKCGNKLK